MKYGIPKTKKAIQYFNNFPLPILPKLRSFEYLCTAFMKITNKKLLEQFTKRHTGSTKVVNKWIEIIEKNEIANHNELKAMFPSADYVGNQRYVFNIKGNRFRFVVLIVFLMDFVEIRFCGTHSEYDKIKDIKNI